VKKSDKKSKLQTLATHLLLCQYYPHRPNSNLLFSGTPYSGTVAGAREAFLYDVPSASIHMILIGKSIRN